MTAARDFCLERSDEPDDALFVEAPGGQVPICDGRVAEATYRLSRKRPADRNRACAKTAAVT